MLELRWYPNNGGQEWRSRNSRHDDALSKIVFVGTGASRSEQLDADMKIAKWTSGTTELAVTGFNFGKFMKKDLMDKETSYGLEFYANKEVPDELR